MLRVSQPLRTNAQPLKPSVVIFQILEVGGLRETQSISEVVESRELGSCQMLAAPSIASIEDVRSYVWAQFADLINSKIPG